MSQRSPGAHARRAVAWRGSIVATSLGSVCHDGTAATQALDGAPITTQAAACPL